MAGAETAAADDGNFGHDAVGHGVDHFCARADDAAPLRLFADHEAVHIVKENQRHAVLIAIQDEPGGFLRRFGVNHAAELDALLPGARRGRLHVLLLIRNDADSPAADARIAAEKRLAVSRPVLLPRAASHDARRDFAPPALLARLGGEY